jgi:hypothetical protein
LTSVRSTDSRACSRGVILTVNAQSTSVVRRYPNPGTVTMNSRPPGRTPSGSAVEGRRTA